MKSSQLKFIPGLFMNVTMSAIMINIALFVADIVSSGTYVKILLLSALINVVSMVIYNAVMDVLERNELYAKLK